MGQTKLLSTIKQCISVHTTKDSVERLMIENFELRNTAVELTLQTAILRERLSTEGARELAPHNN
jgi:metal-sulfur cluster biosynthetic enzyme